LVVATNRRRFIVEHPAIDKERQQRPLSGEAVRFHHLQRQLSRYLPSAMRSCQSKRAPFAWPAIAIDF
jgi:hypothetical protein